MALLPQDVGSTRTFIFNIFFGVLATSFVILRFWAVRITKRPLRPHDGLLLLGWLLGVGLSVSLTVAIVKDDVSAVESHVAHHRASISYTQKEYVAATCVWLASTLAIKLSVLFLIYDIFITSGFRIANLVMTGIVLAWFMAFFSTVLLVCLPFDAKANPLSSGHICAGQNKYTIMSAATNMIIDLIILILPLPPLWNLHVSTPEKIGLSIVFVHGLMIAIINALRIVYTVNDTPDDAGYNFGLQSTFMVLEVFIGIATACQPCTAAIWKRLFALQPLNRISQLFTSSSGSSSRRSGASRCAKPSISSPSNHFIVDLESAKKSFERRIRVQELSGVEEELPLRGEQITAPQQSMTAMTTEERLLPHLPPMEGRIEIQQGWGVSTESIPRSIRARNK
ncbi:MAG: hypothetical protein M1820_004754 [Bogoriella megaspora]|nr:MAG: hypothetical protein M1820_004754 [Bogoriella megaspora]